MTPCVIAWEQKKAPTTLPNNNYNLRHTYWMLVVLVIIADGAILDAIRTAPCFSEKGSGIVLGVATLVGAFRK